MKYLVDSSALIRLRRKQVDAAWQGLVGRGLIAVCEPVLAEVLCMADSRQYREAEEDITSTYMPVTVPDDVWRLSAVIRRELATRSSHQALSVADLVIAATGIRLKLTVLHEDADFETVARFFPGFEQHRLRSDPPPAG
jgi:predicted nucleic acid-binding protein